MTTEPTIGPDLSHQHGTKAIDDRMDLLEARIAKLEGIPPTVPPPVPLSGVYGPAINADSKSNLQVGWNNKAKLSHRFRSRGGTIVSVRFAQRGGPGSDGKPIYSNGSGGSQRITIQTDLNGVPSGTILGSATYVPGNPGVGTTAWAKFDAVPISAPVMKGQLYHVVFENTDANQAANYISVNELFVFGTVLSPRQPRFPLDDYAVLYADPTWHVEGQFTADMDVAYADGSHDGMGYVQNMIDRFASISGTKMARQTFTPQADHTFNLAAVRLRRATGISPLTVTLDTPTGPQVLGTVAAQSVPITAAGGDNGGSVWAIVTAVGQQTVSAGRPYALRFSCPADTTYTVAPIREGTDSGYDASLAFPDGQAEYTLDGKTWQPPYAFSPVDWQCYLR